MRHRRWIIIASAFVLVIVAGLFLLQNGPLAQPPPPEPPGPEAIEMPGPGGPGGDMMYPEPGMGPGMSMGPGAAASG